MQYFPHLPPILRVAIILGVLFLLTGVVLLLVDDRPVENIGVNLSALGLGCISVVAIYRIRFRQPDRRSFPLDSWQSQLRAIALVAAVPICALMLAVFIPPTSPAFAIVFPVTLLGYAVLLATCWVWIIRVR